MNQRKHYTVAGAAPSTTGASAAGVTSGTTASAGVTGVSLFSGDIFFMLRADNVLIITRLNLTATLCCG